MNNFNIEDKLHRFWKRFRLVMALISLAYDAVFVTGVLLQLQSGVFVFSLGTVVMYASVLSLAAVASGAPLFVSIRLAIMYRRGPYSSRLVKYPLTCWVLSLMAASFTNYWVKDAAISDLLGIVTDGCVLHQLLGESPQLEYSFRLGVGSLVRCDYVSVICAVAYTL